MDNIDISSDVYHDTHTEVMEWKIGPIYVFQFIIVGLV